MVSGGKSAAKHSSHCLHCAFQFHSHWQWWWLKVLQLHNYTIVDIWQESILELIKRCYNTSFYIKLGQADSSLLEFGKGHFWERKTCSMLHLFGFSPVCVFSLIWFRLGSLTWDVHSPTHLCDWELSNQPESPENWTHALPSPREIESFCSTNNWVENHSNSNFPVST